MSEGRGVLYCHPMQLTDVAAWLSQHAHLGWRLEADAKLLPGEMRLMTEGGALTLRW
ncbi:HrpE/YscL family type III secretion apparatus protein [Symbiopectobacterium sp.]|uniref:HrpE/YscL family type III secretion apparatus protein n=1 Tax=Symbiopectobacterium sp. TaxID=2952789 RepID=UPI003F2E76AC